MAGDTADRGLAVPDDGVSQEQRPVPLVDLSGLHPGRGRLQPQPHPFPARGLPLQPRVGQKVPKGGPEVAALRQTLALQRPPGIE